LNTKVTLFFLVFFSFLQAQEQPVHSVFFEFDKYNISDKQTTEIVEFITKIDTNRVESIEIFGYCDDRGSNDYNYKLSNNRAQTIKNLLVAKGVKIKIIIQIEGKGRVLIDDDILDKIPEIRAKSRRVDIVVNTKETPLKLDIPGVYTAFKKQMVVGDRIYLEKLYFERGSSKLTSKACAELDKIALQLHRYPALHIEIQGHVCCTPTHQKEAVDKDTRKRELSKNRAKAVYNYLIYRLVKKERLTYKGLGNSQPLGKAPDLDRRVELVVVKI